MLTVGRLVGRLPFSFDVNFDSFFISPSGEYLLFCKEDRSVILYKVRLQSSQYPVLIPHIFWLMENVRTLDGSKLGLVRS